MAASAWSIGLCSIVALAVSCGGRVGLDDSESGAGGGVGNSGGSGGSGGGKLGGSGGKNSGSGGKSAGSGGFVATGGSATGGGTPAGGSVAIGGAAGFPGGSAGIGGGAGMSYRCMSKTSLSGFQTTIADYESFTSPQDLALIQGVRTGTYVYTDPFDMTAWSSVALVQGRETGNQQAFRALFHSSTWGGGLGFWFDNCISASNFAGLILWVRGNVPTGFMRLSLMTAEVYPYAEGGLCNQPDCQPSEVSLPVTEVWSEHLLFWSSFSAAYNPDYGFIGANGDNLLNINIQLDNDSTSREFWIEVDDVAFLILTL